MPADQRQGGGLSVAVFLHNLERPADLGSYACGHDSAKTVLRGIAHG